MSFATSSHSFASSAAQRAAIAHVAGAAAASSVVRSSSGLAGWQLRRATHYLEQHACESVRVADLAALVGLSISHFTRAFKASTGMPPHHWQTHRRIRTAQQMMMEGAQPLAEIALATGFSDQSHFTRVFRARIGTTPAAWQRRARTVCRAP